ncbi:branched-chain amino acid ABC transporter, permease protein (plasmid) [Ruegeria pomeroyi DSS-3]|uniref:Branched-chain amino acid ABC transporter, permease protein n=2 Tax=Ruegeria pomeroyi TaxID=89184 RepID=Q5LLD0_RUEPO|nr:branched-chain amino acid ABC transporter permease [Ruegeria pomeroyi]AAV97235.1 branched-chain amino acid ABC transporter, permease protein [Ruegeria pomeroyi DSS-3]NVK98119.1 branched-chain amino acid ABC transporter permease [Ruegeria pomeroyi]NVL02698.1 branched-chain amino acid ABC transporter permease [Ruegeria pomeroyi]HCE71159.1 branched-chain amino acid ABC transporter permease [Ruegeria sp.]
MSIVIDILINGLFLGGLYALFGLGLTLIFGVMRIANIAHGEIAVAGALALFTLGGNLPVHPLVLLPVVMVLAFGLGWLLQAQLINRVLSADPMPALLLTFGLSVVLQNLMVEIYGADNRSIDIGTIKTAGFQIGGVTLGYLPLAIFLLALVLFGLLHLGLQHTRLGRAIRATSQDADIVALFGIRQKRVFALVMALAAGFAALAGMLLAMRSTITPFSGAERLLIAFEVIVIGGLGSIWASYLGGIALALVHVASFYFDPASGLLYGHLTLLLFLLLRPQGIAGKVVTR